MTMLQFIEARCKKWRDVLVHCPLRLWYPKLYRLFDWQQILLHIVDFGKRRNMSTKTTARNLHWSKKKNCFFFSVKDIATLNNYLDSIMFPSRKLTANMLECNAIETNIIHSRGLSKHISHSSAVTNCLRFATEFKVLC